MRNIKASMMTLGIGGAVILGASLSILYIREGQDQHLLRQELSSVSIRLEKLPKTVTTDDLVAQQRDLETGMTRAKSDIEAAKSRLMISTDSIETTNLIVDLGNKTGVSKVSFESPGWSEEQLKGYPFSSLLLTVTAEGDIPNLVNFISAVTSQFPTGRVQSSQITVPKPNSRESVKPPRVIMVLSLYNYEGK